MNAIKEIRSRRFRRALGLRTLVLTLCALLACPPQLLFAADLTAAGTTNTQVTAAKNGVPVVNIAAPSATGLSHNQFTNYNVDSKGLVLNNGNTSEAYRQSQLAGVVGANPNLGAGAQASVILNEVTGSNRSVLSGFTEVLGGKADVIVANPFGITCNGCGFINTDRASLVTGTPNVSGGALQSFSVNGGDILITGTGLNANAQQMLDLVSRKVYIEAQVNAKNLNVLAGAFRWNRDTGATSALDLTESPSGPAPTFGIDASALGAMYAGRITLRSTEAGVGVRMQNEAAATADDFTITSAGSIQLRNAQVSAARNVALTAGVPSGGKPGRGDILVAGGSVTAGGDIALANDRSGGVSSGNTVLSTGALKAGGALSITTGKLDDTGTDTPATADENKRAGQSVTIDADQDHVAFFKVFYSSAGAMNINGQSFSVTDSQFSSGAGMTLRGVTGDMTLNNVQAQSGSGTMSILTPGGALNLDRGTQLKSTSGNITLLSRDAMHTTGAISAEKGTLGITAGGDFYNSAPLYARSMTLSAQNIDFMDDVLLSRSLTLNGHNLTVSKNLEANTQRITLNGQLDVFGRVLGNSGSADGALFITAPLVNINDNALVYSVYGISVDGKVIVNPNGTISAANDLSISNGLSNSGLAYAGRDLTIGTSDPSGMGEISNYAHDAYTLGVHHYAGYTGTIQAGRDMNLNVGSAGTLTNNSIITAGHNLSFLGKTFINSIPASSIQDPSVGSRVNYVKTVSEQPPYLANGYWYKVVSMQETWDQTVGHTTTASLMPQITAGTTGTGQMLIKDFTTGINNSGLIQAPTVYMVGNLSGATFTNSVITSETDHYLHQWKVLVKYDPWNFKDIEERNYDDSTSYSRTLTDSTTAGIRATRLLGSGFALSNLGSPLSVSTIASPKPTATSFPGLVLTLPTNPNGLYIPSKDPNSKYLVESNPLFSNIDNYLGSDYLAKKYNVDPDTTIKRLGDAAYETYLVQQQLVAQIGATKTNINQSDKQQMQSFMDGAARQATSMSLVYGQALTDAQQASLKSDMIWMVETTVNGQKVLAPVVYLSATTRKLFQPGAQIVADNMSLDVTSLDNVGGTIKGKTIAVTSKGDITNTSGTITGINVALKSTEGSIVNKTYTSTNGSDKNHNQQTSVGEQATIAASTGLDLSAKKDIVNKGAKVFAGAEANLTAGGNVTFDTVENKAASQTGVYKDGYETSTTQITSSLTGLKGVNIKAGKDVTLAGTAVKSDFGDVNVDAGGNVNILARDDKSSKRDTTRESGFGVGGGIFGTTTTTTTNAKTSNVGSTIEGGAVNISSGKTVTLQGSDVKSRAQTTVAAEDLKILAGHDSETTTTETQTSTVFSLTAPGGGDLNLNGKAEASAEARAGQEGAGGAGASASASASGGINKDGSTGDSASKAKAKTSQKSSTGAAAAADSSASGSIDATMDAGGFDISKTITTTTTDSTTTARGSTLSAGTNLVLKAKKTATLEGAALSAKGDVDISAGKGVTITDVQDTHKVSTSTSTDRAGLYFSTDTGASGSAELKGSASVGTPSSGVSATAGANGEVTTKNNIDLGRGTYTTTDTTDTTSKGSNVSAGGKLRISSGEQLTVKGSALSGEKDVNLSASKMDFQAGQDTHTSSTSTTNFAFGAYLDGSFGGKVGATGSASAGAGVAADAGAEAKVTAGASAGLQGRHKVETTTEGSTTAKVVNITSGSGSITRTAQTSITDEGTNASAAGDFKQTAQTWTNKAAKDTSYSTSSTLSNSAKVGVAVKGEAGANAGAGGSAGLGLTGHAEADADAKVGAGVEASYSGSLSTTKVNASTARTSNIKAGGTLSSTTTGATSLEGTNLSGGEGVVLGADSLKFSAAKNTKSTQTMDGSVDVSGKAIVNFGVGTAVDVDASAAVKGSGSTRDESTAVAGGITSGRGISIRTAGDTSLEGTQIKSAGDTTVQAGGKLDFTAARDTVKTTGTDFNASGEFTTTKGKSMGGVGVSAEGGFTQSSTGSSTAHAGDISSGGNVKLSAGKAATFEGTKLSAGGDASISGGEGVTMSAAKSTSSSESYGASGKASLGAEKKDETKTGKAEASAEGNYKKSSETTSEAGSLTAGRNLSITSGKDVTLEGTALEAKNKASVKAEGSVDFKAAENTKDSLSVGGKLSGKTEVENTSSDKSGKSGKSGTTTPKTGTAGTGKDDTEDGTTTKTSGSTSFTLKQGSSTTQTGGGIKAGAGGIEIEARKGDVNLVGTNVETSGNGSITAGRNVNITEAKTTEKNLSVDVDASAALNTKSGKAKTAEQQPATGADKKDTGDKGSTPDSSKKANTGTGGTQGSDGSKKGDADLKTWQDKQDSVLDELKKKNAASGGSAGGSSAGSAGGSSAGSKGGSAGSSSGGGTAGSNSGSTTGGGTSGGSTGSSTGTGADKTPASGGDKKNGVLDNMGGVSGTLSVLNDSDTQKSGATLKTGGTLKITSGGKTTITGAKTDAKGGETIDAAGGKEISN